MKKIFLIVLMMIITMMVLPNEKSIYHDQTVELIKTFQVQKITYNNEVGYFIPLIGWNRVNNVLDNYFYMQDQINILNETLVKYDKFKINNFRIKTALGISIAFDIGLLFISVGLGILTYNIARYQ